MRSLAHDLGQELECGAHLRSLVRFQTGRFSLFDALTLEELEHLAESGDWTAALHPIDAAVYDLKAVIVGRSVEYLISHGTAVNLGPSAGVGSEGDMCRAYGVDGRFLAILRAHRDAGVWHPESATGPRGSPVERAIYFLILMP